MWVNMFVCCIEKKNGSDVVLLCVCCACEVTHARLHLGNKLILIFSSGQRAKRQTDLSRKGQFLIFRASVKHVAAVIYKK